MNSFSTYVDRELYRSFVYVGQQVSLNESANDITNSPEAAPAVGLVRRLASGIKMAVGKATEFVNSLKGMSPEDAVAHAKKQLDGVLSEFDPLFDRLKTQTGQQNEGLLSGGLSMLRRGAEFLIKRMIVPIINAAYRSVVATARHVLGSIWGAGQSMGVQGYLGMIAATALTVALWPVLASVSLLAHGTLGATLAVGGTGMSVWLLFMFMSWFKVNVIGKAVMGAEGISPPRSLRYGI